MIYYIGRDINRSFLNISGIIVVLKSDTLPDGTM